MPASNDTQLEQANNSTETDVNGNEIAPIHLVNAPAKMPEKGTKEYEQLAQEVGNAKGEIEEGFNYSAHIAATRKPENYPDWLDPVKDVDSRWVAAEDRADAPAAVYVPSESEAEAIALDPEQVNPISSSETDANGIAIAPIYLENPPATMPKKGSLEYALLAQEVGNANGEISAGFNYKAHIAATRKPKDYPNWIDPITDIDDRWVDASKIDTSMKFEKKLEDYDFFKRKDGTIEIKTEEGFFDDITGIPKLQFSDKAVSAIAEIEATFDQVKAKDDVTGKMFRVYNAAFNRFPDSDGLEYWIEKNSSGENTERQVAESFLASSEFKEKYGEDVSNEQYVNNLYNNILGRDADADGYNYWVGQLNNGIEDRSELLLGFAESNENQLLFSEVTGLY